MQAVREFSGMSCGQPGGPSSIDLANVRLRGERHTERLDLQAMKLGREFGSTRAFDLPV